MRFSQIFAKNKYSYFIQSLSILKDNYREREINMTNISWKFQGKPTNCSNFIFRERSKFQKKI